MSIEGIYSALSFNLWVANVTEERQKRVIEAVKLLDADTVGFQEASPQWMNILKNSLSDEYGFVGCGRDGGENGEHNPIFYKKSRFTLVSEGTMWLSDTPHEVSKHPDSSLNRIFTHAVLRCNDTGVNIHFVNTHFDHIGETARQSQAVILCDYIKGAGGLPTVLTGDFNTGPESPAYKTITAGGMKDSSLAAKKSRRTATFINFGRAKEYIDFIFTSSEVEDCEYLAYDGKVNGDYPSDHLPIFAKYRIK